MKTILLAAGLSTRMGCQKLLLPFQGRTVLSAVLEQLLQSSLTPVIMVTSEDISRKITLLPPEVIPVINPAPERGQSESMRLGLEQLEEGDDFCLMLGDLPFATSLAMVQTHREFLGLPANYSALVPVRGEKYGHPSFFSFIWRDRFLAVQGDVGGRHMIKKYQGEVCTCCGDDSFFRDLDTQEDYKNLSAYGVSENYAIVDL